MLSLTQLGAKTDNANTKLDALGPKADEANASLNSLADKAEKRTPISKLPFTITKPGSYYITGNLTGTNAQSGITINVGHVTVDLNGFSLIAGSGGTDGVAGSGANIRVYNGTVSGWTKNGINLSSAVAGQLDHLRASGNGNGFNVGADSTLSYCVGYANTSGVAATGIMTGSRCLLHHCVTTKNVVGANLGDGTHAEDCVFDANQTAGAIFASRCSFARCSANGSTGPASPGFSSNASVGTTFANCTAWGNGGSGLVAGSGGNVLDCVASENLANGITVENKCVVQNNNCASNKAAGIASTGTLNRIESNLALSNKSYGISSSASNGDIIIRNISALNNGQINSGASPDYNPKSGQYVGVFTVPGAANPSAWANF